MLGLFKERVLVLSRLRLKGHRSGGKPFLAQRHLVGARRLTCTLVSHTGRLDKKHSGKLSASAFEHKSEIFTALQASLTDG